MESSEPGIKARIYHIIDNAMKNGYAGVIAITNESSPLDTVARRTAPAIKKFIISTFVLLVVLNFVTIPQFAPGVSSVDSTLWVGVLSFEGAIALGYMAIVPWLTKVNMRALVAMLTLGIRSELLTFNSEHTTMTADSFEASAESEINEKSIGNIMARCMFRGALYLFTIIVIMPLGIWLNAHWKAAVLCVSVYWVWGLLQELLLPAALAYSDLLQGIFKFLTAEHAAIANSCPICSSSHSSQRKSASPPSSSVGIGTWFIRTTWLALWGTCIRNNGLSPVWTWILLFVPIYISIILYAGGLVRQWIKSRRLRREQAQ